MEENKKICWRCRQTIDAEERFCQFCGANQQSYQAPGGEAAVPIDKERDFFKVYASAGTKTLTILLGIVCIYNVVTILAALPNIGFTYYLGLLFYIAALILLGFKSPAAPVLVIAYNIIYNLIDMVLYTHIYINFLDWGLAIPTLVLMNQLHSAYKRFQHTGIRPEKKI